MLLIFMRLNAELLEGFERFISFDQNTQSSMMKIILVSVQHYKLVRKNTKSQSHWVTEVVAFRNCREYRDFCQMPWFAVIFWFTPFSMKINCHLFAILAQTIVWYKFTVAYFTCFFTQQSARMCLFLDRDIIVVRFTLRPFSCCAHCCLIFYPKCK